MSEDPENAFKGKPRRNKEREFGSLEEVGGAKITEPQQFLLLWLAELAETKLWAQRDGVQGELRWWNPLIQLIISAETY
jgi:hypothetical protein